MTLLIIGAGGHGRDVAATARALDLQYRLVDDNPDLWMPAPETWDGPWVIGIGDPELREKFSTRYPHPAATLVDPRSHVGPDIAIGEGSVVGPSTTLLTECTIGRHVHIVYNVAATRCHIGDFTTVGPGVTFCGYVHIGRRSYIGAGSVIRNKVRIGDDCIIGAGSNVIEDVPDGTTVKGNPAR